MGETMEVLFTRPRAFWRPSAWLVRLLTWAPYNHVGLCLGDVFVESLAEGTVWTSRASLLRKARIMAKFEVEVDSKRLMAALEAVKDRPYDWHAVVALGWVRLRAFLGLPPPKQRAGSNAKRRLFCSEMVYYVLRDCGVVPRIADPALLDPKRLLRLLESCRPFRRLY